MAITTHPVALLGIGLLTASLALGGCSAGRRPASVPTSASAVSHPAVGERHEYLVQRGDTLAGIARRFGTDYATLADLNGLRPPYTIYPGQRLRLPGGVPSTPAAPAMHWMWPTDGWIARGFSVAHGGNKGLDLAGRIGQPVRAAAAGTVMYAGNGLRQYGNLLIVKHNADYLSAYAHLQHISVAEGKAVAAGETIATMGSRDDNQGLLHFEIRYRGAPVDPAQLLPRRPES